VQTEIYPNYNKKWKFILQAHIRGRSVHLDFRYEVIKNHVLYGWTIAAIKSLPNEPSNLAEAKKLVYDKVPALKKDFENPLNKYVCIQKQPQPFQWIMIDNTTFGSGELGGTSEKSGYMFALDKGLIEYGALKSYFYEYWLHGEKKLMDGRFIVRSLANIWKQRAIDEGDDIKTGKGLKVNMCWFADENDPYVLSDRAVEKGWMPPLHVSALPKYIMSQIKNEFRFWHMDTEESAKKIRHNLIEYNNLNHIKYQ